MKAPVTSGSVASCLYTVRMSRGGGAAGDGAAAADILDEMSGGEESVEQENVRVYSGRVCTEWS